MLENGNSKLQTATNAMSFFTHKIKTRPSSTCLLNVQKKLIIQNGTFWKTFSHVYIRHHT